MGISLLKQERLNRNWSRAYVEAKTGIPQRSLENWEEGIVLHPHQESIEMLCRLYSKSAKDLGLDKNDRIAAENIVSPNSQEKAMSDLIRRAALSDLGSKLSRLVNTWPRRNYHYDELQGEINQAVIDYNTLVALDSTYEINRRQALKSLGLVPIQLVGDVERKIKKPETDTDALLIHCAAGVAAAWHLRRGKDLEFANDLASTYISILQPLLSSKSEGHRKAAATLLSQSARLKGSITEHLKNNNQGIAYYNEAIQYAIMSENIIEQALANRMIAFSYWRQGAQGYEQALFHAEKAYRLVGSSSSKMARSFTGSGLSLCQAVSGHTEDAKMSLAQARDFFDTTTPLPSVYYTESNLIAISADVYQYRGLWKESVDLWEKSLVVPDISALGAIQARINYAKTEVSRDDQDRNMDLCVKLLTEAIDGAKELDSQRYIHEASECCNLLRAAWPCEQAIKDLRAYL